MVVNVGLLMCMGTRDPSEPGEAGEPSDAKEPDETDQPVILRARRLSNSLGM